MKARRPLFSFQKILSEGCLEQWTGKTGDQLDQKKCTVRNRLLPDREAVHEVTAVGNALIDISGVLKPGVLIKMKRSRIIPVHAYFYLIVSAFFAENGKNLTQSFAAVPFVLETLVDHKLLQVIACRFFVQTFYECSSDHLFSVGYAVNSGAAGAVSITACKNAGRRVKKCKNSSFIMA